MEAIIGIGLVWWRGRKRDDKMNKKIKHSHIQTHLHIGAYSHQSKYTVAQRNGAEFMISVCALCTSQLYHTNGIDSCLAAHTHTHTARCYGACVKATRIAWMSDIIQFHRFPCSISCMKWMVNGEWWMALYVRFACKQHTWRNSFSTVEIRFQRFDSPSQIDKTKTKRITDDVR